MTPIGAERLNSRAATTADFSTQIPQKPELNGFHLRSSETQRDWSSWELVAAAYELRRSTKNRFQRCLTWLPPASCFSPLQARSAFSHDGRSWPKPKADLTVIVGNPSFSACTGCILNDDVVSSSSSETEKAKHGNRLSTQTRAKAQQLQLLAAADPTRAIGTKT